MAESIRVLLAGESWVTHSIHIKGYDSFENSTYQEGGTALIAALEAAGVDVTYQPCHIDAEAFPASTDALAAFDVVILSDIGANTLLLPHRTAVLSERTANRLTLIRDFVKAGGGLLMVGGYMTFQGIQAKANYHGSAVEEVLPIVLSSGDDRVELPEGMTPVVADPDHPIAAGLAQWPHFLGYNRAKLRDDARLVARIGDDPFIAVAEPGTGRSAIFASDCGPHWGPPEFLDWSGYRPLWANLIGWLAGRIG